MDKFYCRSCLAQNRIPIPTIPDNITANVYQLDKYTKHTTLSSGFTQTISILNDPSPENFRGLMVSAAQYGIGAIDSQGRKSLVLDTTKTIGTTFVSGQQRSDNGIRLVGLEAPQTLHFYTTAVQLSGQCCSDCGSALTA